jgi:hypothetical protein
VGAQRDAADGTRAGGGFRGHADRQSVHCREFAWKVWSLDWADASPGEHAITSRAIDPAGNVQPAMDDPVIANKQTYWESNGQVTRRVRVD